MLACGFVNLLSLNILNGFFHPYEKWSVCFANILFFAFFEHDEVDHICSLASVFRWARVLSFGDRAIKLPSVIQLEGRKNISTVFYMLVFFFVILFINVFSTFLTS